MSDYVDNDQQDGFESFDMDFGQPTMAEEFDWNDLDHNTLANIDWMALHEEIKEVVFEDPAEEMQPGDR
ncbi:hypothetical protein IQ06DRAFT_288425 [Phaeosphaeriaceae sp. SRC1lsM3a]|nr:hypothetical protein IQ06DRAFT_288425 [Stagonospora sp. SRC1lsM3a]